MKGGMVVRIRLNPKDCLAILDIMETMGIDVRQRSFASCSSSAFSSLIALARKMKVIKEEEDGFQFLNRMAPFLNETNNKVKQAQSKILWERAQYGSEPPQLVQPSPAKSDVVQASAETTLTEVDGVSVNELMQELQELMELQDSGAVLDSAQLSRYTYLNNVLFS